MKSILAALVLFVAIPAYSQAKPPVTKSPSELQVAKIQLAIKDFQIGQMQAQQAQQSVTNARQAALAQIEAVKKELGLDDTWDYDEASKVFTKKPEPVKPAKVEAPAKK